MTIKLTSNKKPWLRMRKRLLSTQYKSRIGWWGSYYSDGVPVAQVAAWNEEGHMNGGMFAGSYTPPRPFIRVGWMPELKKLTTLAVRDVHHIATGAMNWASLNEKLSVNSKLKLQEVILDWKIPANRQSTIEMKGFDDPLIETGNMYDSVKHLITRK